MVGGKVYSVSAYNLVSAIDAETGRELWTYDPKAYERGRPTHGGFTQRGIEYWGDGERRRIFLVTGVHQLVSLDADTGRPDLEFGEAGMVDMRSDIGTPEEIRQTGLNSPAIVCGNTIMMGMTANDFAMRQSDAGGRYSWLRHPHR